MHDPYQAAVHYLHGRNIVHRDIKPENILVTHDHVCKLCDLGEAQQIDSKRNPQGLLTQTSGTHQFFAPECCGSPTALVSSSNSGVVKFGGGGGGGSDNSSTNADEVSDAAGGGAVVSASRPFSGYAADMWAVGVSLFACIFGILPFYASEPLDLFNLIARGEIRWDVMEKKLRERVLQSNWSEAMEAHTSDQVTRMMSFMQRLLAIDPAKRITVAEAAQDPWLTFDGHVPIEVSLDTGIGCEH